MIRVLHCVSNMDRAGIETMLMNYYRHIDRTEIQFDFLCNKRKKGAYDDEIKSYGGRIFYTPGLNPAKYMKYLSYMNQLFVGHPEYQILEAHNGALGVYALYAARKNHIPVRIFHAHGTNITVDLKYPLKVFCKLQLKANINQNYTCGIAAAECYFGKAAVKSGDYVLIPNAIEVERFIYNNSVRNKIREQYGLSNKKVIGHVGRFMRQKNHTFLLKVFAKIYKKDSDAVLILLGDGNLVEAMKKLANELGVADRVHFIGNVENVNEWYNAFDVFVLPSVWEGLPVVGVEAQANDLPCIFSDSVTKEICFTHKAKFLSLRDDMEKWADAILQAGKCTIRNDNTDLITKKHYNIQFEAKRLQARYMKLYDGRRTHENWYFDTSLH